MTKPHGSERLRNRPIGQAFLLVEALLPTDCRLWDRVENAVEDPVWSQIRFGVQMMLVRELRE